jgi:hypothetical protein
LNRGRDGVDPESRGDQRERRLYVGNPLLDTGCEARLATEREHFVVEGGRILRRSNEEDVGRKVRDVDGCPVGQRVITRESDDDRLPPERLIHDT